MIDARQIDGALDAIAVVLLSFAVCWLFLVAWPTERPEGEQ